MVHVLPPRAQSAPILGVQIWPLPPAAHLWVVVRGRRRRSAVALAVFGNRHLLSPICRSKHGASRRRRRKLFLAPAFRGLGGLARVLGRGIAAKRPPPFGA
jgi:hypothetical protein